jgi:hypothetical protein
MGRLEHHLHPVKPLVVKCLVARLLADLLVARKVLWKASSGKCRTV